ncbi:MAG: aminotransferase class I/II-fold pyridoxal phosphate-dependent enzyme [Nanoarchaeota archaeon]|nr:aminotransferase class I/II-fold pyridoxal phosphate-dependent enzyme [Nanoarchaeota archaeon]
MQIKHSKPSINEKDVSRAVQILSSGKLADYSQVKRFEGEMANYIGQKEGIAVNSGTNALHLALLALDGKNSKDEVIIPSYVCIALLNAITAANLKPRIVDINKNDYNIYLDEIKKKINTKTKAVIVPHMFGDPIKNIEEIVEQMVNLNVPIIEDCALSVGAGIKGKKIGNFSDLSVFSFYATKVLTTGHGGMILSKSEKLLDKLKDFMQYDNREFYKESFNFRMTDFQAAVGRNQLLRLPDFIKRRREIAKIYNESFKNQSNIKIPSRPEESIFFRYILEVEDVNKFIDEMSKENISCAKPIFKPLHQYFNLDKNNFPNTEKAHKHSVSIPLYPALKDNEVKYVVENVLKSMKKL